MTARYALHGIWASGPTYKVGLMLSLSEEPFDFEHVELRQGEHKTSAFLAKQRYGQVPLLVDRENGRHLCQSAAILEYLADTLGRFGGATLDERLQAREWMYWDFDRLSRGIYRPRAVKAGFWQLSPEVLEHYENEGGAALKFLDKHLAGRSWLVGEGATIADIGIYGVVAYAPQAGYDLGQFSNLAAWMNRFERLPGFAAPGELLPKESKAA